jgi:hypothetical protein
MIATNINLKRWTILNAHTNKIHELTDQEFKEGLNNHCITLRGQYIEVNRQKYWIDGIIKK